MNGSYSLTTRLELRSLQAHSPCRDFDPEVAERGFLYAMPWKVNDLWPVSVEASRLLRGLWLLKWQSHAVSCGTSMAFHISRVAECRSRVAKTIVASFLPVGANRKAEDACRQHLKFSGWALAGGK